MYSYNIKVLTLDAQKQGNSEESLNLSLCI